MLILSVLHNQFIEQVIVYLILIVHTIFYPKITTFCLYSFVQQILLSFVLQDIFTKSHQIFTKDDAYLQDMYNFESLKTTFKFMFMLLMAI